MIKKIMIIRELKKLRKKPVDKIFLNSLKMRLEVLVDTSPGRAETSSPIRQKLNDIFRLRVAQVSIAVFMITILLGTSVATASQGSLPGERLYPVKIFTEEIRSITTLKDKEKAKLSMSFAERRIHEIEEVLEKTELESDALEKALDQLDKNLSRATAITETEKSLAVSMEGEAMNINQDIHRNKEVLEKIMKEKKKRIENKQKELEADIKKANTLDGSDKETLIDELVEVRIDKEILERLETKKEREDEEIKDGKDEDYLLQEVFDKDSISTIDETKDRRKNIKSREESRKDVRDKIMKELSGHEDRDRNNDDENDSDKDSGDDEGDRKDENHD